MGNKTRAAQQAHRAQQQRQCGGCTACCTTERVPELAKPFFSPCTHAQPGTGCAIYGTRPSSCAAWSCLWLSGADVGERPDQSGIVVNVVPPDVAGHPLASMIANTGMGLVHANCLPDRPDAHRNAGFQRWLAKNRVMAEVLRVVGNQAEYLMVTPPSDESGGWLEVSFGGWPLIDVQHTGGEGLAIGEEKPRFTMVNLGGSIVEENWRSPDAFPSSKHPGSIYKPSK